MATCEEIRELDFAETDGVSGGRLPAVVQNIIDMVACVVHGGDWSSNGVSSVCSGPPS